MLDKGEK